MAFLQAAPNVAPRGLAGELERLSGTITRTRLAPNAALVAPPSTAL